MKNSKFIGRAVAVIAAAVFTTMCFTQSPALGQPRPATVRASTGVSQAPYCHWQTTGSSGNRLSYVTMIGSYTDCDLMVSDALHSPSMCVYAFDVENAHTSATYCSGFAQNQISDTVSGRWSCTLGHRLYVDSFMKTYRGTWAVGGSGAVKVVCGGGTW